VLRFFKSSSGCKPRVGVISKYVGMKLVPQFVEGHRARPFELQVTDIQFVDGKMTPDQLTPPDTFRGLGRAALTQNCGVQYFA
jgi:hypothetical protein